jgi:hypothetical protein
MFYADSRPAFNRRESQYELSGDWELERSYEYHPTVSYLASAPITTPILAEPCTKRSRVVERRLTSALITEDDIDWDIHLRHQLEELAHGLRIFRKRATIDHSPYTDGWE